MPASAPPDRIIAGFQAVYEEAEYEALRVLADAVARKAKKADRDDLAAQAAEITRLRTQLDGIATSLNRKVGRALPETLTEANLWGGRQAIADLDAAFGPASRTYDSPINQGALNHLARSMADQLTPVHLAVTRNVEDAYKAIIGASTTGVLTGTQTRVEATQRAMDRFAAAGIRGFTDKAGRNWQLSTYAEMAIRTAAARAAVDAHVETLVQSGVELGYCSDSPQECGLCRPFEHKIITLTGSNGPGTVTTINELTDEPTEVEVVGSLAYIRALGFLHPNCTHAVAIYLHGLTKLRTNTENPQGYDDRQQLRKLERDVRAAKRVEAAALTPDAAKTAAARVRAGQAAIRDHVKATGLIRQPHREQLVDGDAAAAITPQRTLARAKRDQARERARLRRQIGKGQDAEERQRRERELAEEQAAALAAEKARLVAEQKARELEKAALADREARAARERAEAAARAEAERLAREEAERVAREEAERAAREEAERLAREEAERLAREEAERKRQEKLAKDRARKAAQRAKAREERDRLAQEAVAPTAGATESLPTVDETRVTETAGRIRELVAEYMGPNPDLASSEQRRATATAIRDLLDSQYPGSAHEDVDLAISRAIRSYARPAGRGVQGRGAELAVRALERDAAYWADGRSVQDYVAAARAQLGQGFEARMDVHGAPDPATKAVLDAVRAAGAAVMHEASRATADQLETVKGAEQRWAETSRRVSAALEGLQDRAIAEYMAAHPRKRKQPPDLDWIIYDPDAADLGKMPQEQQDALRTAIKEQLAERDAAARAAQEARRVDQVAVLGDARREVLGQVRPMGGELDLVMGNGMTPDQVKRTAGAFELALASFPAAWLERAAKQQVTVTRAEKRGYFAEHDPRLDALHRALGKEVRTGHQLEIGQTSDLGMQGSVVIHELGHFMEATTKVLRQLEYAYVHDRVTRPNGRLDEVSTIYQGTAERGWEDDFLLHYTGKVYRDDGNMSWEVLTTGLEQVLGPYDTASGDLDFNQFVLGMLAIA